jgi:hypothetical protein
VEAQKVAYKITAMKKQGTVYVCPLLYPHRHTDRTQNTKDSQRFEAKTLDYKGKKKF